MKNNSHVARVFALWIIAGVMGFGVRHLLLPDTFGTVGHYRTGSLKDILNLEQIYQSKNARAQRHGVYDIHEKDVHYAIEKAVKNNPGR